MKEEAKGKKLPPKIVVGGSAAAASSTPTKVQSDEILGALLRINNFDSISSIKDESLDIDLSACVTICADTSAMMNSNSLSSTDFWRVLDESAQNPQLDMNGSDDSLSSIIATPSSSSSAAAAACMSKLNGGGNPVGGPAGVKDEKVNSFSGTFLRPEAPVTCSPSPFKKSRALPVDTPHPLQFPAHPQMKSMLAAAATTSPAKSPAGKTRPISSYMIKLEPQEQEDVKPAASSASPFAGASNTETFSGEASTVTQKETPPVPEGPPPEPQYKCVDCGGQVLHGKEEFSAHHQLHHRILYKCALCERDFEQESGLKKHLKTHRAVDARKDAWKKCPDCGKCLKLGSLWMHRKIHSENKKYGCDICGQKFVQKINLTHHSRVHITEKPYECPECQKRFQERSHLQRHQKYHAQTRSYRCDKCGKMYKTERCLKVHTLVHLEQRPFACNLCDKSFISNSKLKQHSNIHTGNRPFKCNYCPRDFTNFPNWLKHTRRRHKVDHKTGEHLENIPSYCSKKSTKGTKKQQAAAAAASAASTGAVANVATPQQTTQLLQGTGQQVPAPLENISNAATNVMQDKLPANGAAAGPLPAAAGLKTRPAAADKAKPPKIVLLGGPQLTTTTLTTTNSTTTTTLTTTTNSATTTLTTKAVKVKRERKQSAPKQVQKAAAALLAASAIKKEAVPEPKPSRGKQLQQQQHQQQLMQQPTTTTTTAPFPDLHCLSLTSAEDLIMEQALEMEESGLYHNRASLAEAGGDTDNAISADSAAMCFKIKSEYTNDDQQDDEYLTISGEANNGNILCPSLESSPFSSPASLEVTSSAAAMDRHQAASAIIAPDFITSTASGSGTRSSITGGTTTTTTYYIPANFPLNLQSQQVRSALGQAPPNSLSLHQQHTVMQRQSNIYFPMAMTAMPLLQPSQMLPSVETLLAGNGNGGGGAPTNLLAKGPGVAGQAAQHNLS